MTDTITICATIIILACIYVLAFRPRLKEISFLSSIVYELIGITPASQAKWGMPERDEIIAELKRLKGNEE